MRPSRSLVTACVLAALVAAVAGTAHAQGDAPRRNDLGVAFNHVSVEVPDFERELAFWTALGGGSRTVADGFAIATFPDMNVTVRRGHGSGGTEGSLIGHIGFQVPEIAAGEQRFRDAGLDVEPGGFPGQRWLTSPSGVRVEILQDPNLAVPIRGHHVHFFLPAPLEMQEWYADVLGAVPGRRGNFDAADITAANTVMNLTFSSADEALPATKGRALDHIAFSVTNLRAFMDRLQGMNVRVDQPFALQQNGRTGIAFVIDPWGTRIELIDQEAGAPAAADADGRMLRPRYITHVVADLGASVAFYREGLELEVAEGPQPLTASALVQRVVSQAPGATARHAVLDIPGSALQLQLVEFDGVAAQAFEQRLYDPGVTRFSIQVRDIDRAFDRVKDLGITVDTTSAGPVFTQRPRNNTRAVMMRDPDGFVFEFVQSGNPIQTDVPESSNIYNARSSLALDNIERALAFYRDLLGFEQLREPGYVNDAVLALEGTPRARARTVSTMPPGSDNMWVFWEFSDIDRTRREPDPQDPGASSITLEVENLDALVSRMRMAGVTIETADGGAVAIGDGRRAILVRSPDGLLVELVES